MKVLSGGCTLDCYDACKFNVYTEDNNIAKIEGDKCHPYTKGFICKKGLKHVKRHNHLNRQYKPLLKVNHKWEEITFEEAIDIMAKKLNYYKENYGSKSFIYYEQYGSGSLLKSIGEIFFNFFGGSCKQKGGPCWSAGIEAQKRNFGDVKSHSLEDMLNSKTIIVWGKNPANTTIHTMNMIKIAQKSGANVIVIDPILTPTAKQADFHLRIKPGGDGALALAMGKRIIELNLHNEDYINKHVKNFDEYKAYLDKLNLRNLCKMCGVTLPHLDFIVKKYAEIYSTILQGYGMQKYNYGGSTIGYINTLGAITGQIGYSGGGVNYANRVYPDILNTDPYHSYKYADDEFFYVSKISDFIEEKNIKMAVITKSNLLNQLPQLKKLEKAMSKIEFKVCFDLFLTDTAESCDLFIPVTSVFESEDLLYSSMTNPYLTYIEKALEPENDFMDEYYFFQEVARKLNLTNYPYVDKKEYLEKVIEPLRNIENDISLDYLAKNYFTIHKCIAWEDKRFKTESGKFEIFINEKALNPNKVDEEYNFRLLTNHGSDSLFSQHYMDYENKAKAFINKKMASKYKFYQDDLINMESSEGKIEVLVQIDDSICDDVVMMYAGWWKKHGNPNWIIKSGISDIGGQVTYNETFVKLYKY
ncbi:molybdopterin-dependent oxidoreductase [Terrisporobacter glycolicus]|uniref:Assimilatory nitrate reductase catalytic subunit n=1 Tax=Terrisporobacter glycolicus ATCC 14880 = DSM 1288 TaxID=1121315 RepID=A0ABZ2EWU9_9FIRM|nr:molybdopterin-dependent oxidoreductase [Terrisporobacter glycolicus]